MIEQVEKDFFILVEEANGSDSYWFPNPHYLEDEDEVLGSIEIGDDLSSYEKIISLAHEVGHVILEQNPQFGDYKEIIFRESVSWLYGYNYFLERGIEIDLKEYKERASEALGEYIRSLNEK